MAKFWVGGTGNFSDATNHWATVSGGAPGAGNTPTAADDIIFDNLSGTGTATINQATACRSFQTAGTTMTGLTHQNNTTVTVGDATAGAGNIAVDLSGLTTYTLGGAQFSAWTFVSTSATQQTIKFGGKTIANVNMTGVGSSYLLGDTIAQGATATWTHTNGTVDYANFNHVFGFFASITAIARTITLGSGNITCAGSAASAWNITNTGLLTFNKGTSTITLTGTGSILGANNFAGGALTYNNVVIAPTGAGIVQISAANTFANLTLTAPANVYNEIRLAANQTVTGTLTLTGNSVTNRLLVRSNTPGSARILTVATLSKTSFVDFMDVTAAGASAPWSDTGWGVLNVSSITGATAQPNYWVGGTGNWSDSANHWASSSGGTAGTGRVPLIQDSAISDANSGAGTITHNMNYWPATTDFTNTTITSIVHNGGFVIKYVCGNLTIPSSCPGTFGGFADTIFFTGRGSQTFSWPSNTFTTHAIQFYTTGTYTLGSALTSNSTITQTLGTVDQSGFTVTGTAVTLTAGTWTMTNAIMNLSLSGAGTIFTGSSTINASGSTINVTGTASGAQTFAGAGKTYGDLRIAGAVAGSSLSISGGNTFRSINMSSVGVKVLIFASGTTTTLTGGAGSFVSGTAGNLITCQESATTWTLSSATPIVTDYISLRSSTAANAIPFYAGANSTNVSGNTNWNFTAPPATGGGFLTMGIGS